MLSTLFFLLTLGAYVRYTEARSPKPQVRNGKPGSDKDIQPAPNVEPFTILHPPSLLFYVVALLCFALGLMSKPMLVTVPFVLLLLDYWPLSRFSTTLLRSNPPSPHRSTASFLCLIWEKLPFFALSLGSSVITFLVQRKGGAVSTSLSFGERIANALVSYVRYIGKMLWPENLSVLYPHPGHWPTWQVIACAGLLLGISAAVILLAPRRPYLSMGWFWFVGMLVPVIGLVQVGIQSMADRYTYVPLIGLFVMLVWGIAEMVPSRAWCRNALASAAAFSLAACALLTLRQVQHWQNSEALFRHAVQVTPKNYLAYNNLGFYLSKKGRASEAMENYRKSLEINPNYEDALNNLGYALAGQKQYPEAIKLYEAALRVRPNHIEVHNNLGNALSEIGKIDEAIAHYLVTLKQKSDHADAHNNLGIALAMKGKLDEAISHFHDAIRFKPNYASAHSNLGNALAVQHKLDEAVREFQESLRLSPDDAQAHNNLGNALAEQGRVDEAIVHYREALRLNSNNPEAHCNLGLALLRRANSQEAASHFTEALRLKPDYAQARDELKKIEGK